MSYRKDKLSGILRIYLIGFMCSGKSSLGRALAQNLGWKFIDLDEEVMVRERMTIPEIFQEKGEDYFREAEFKTLKEISTLEYIVIATGGGLGANREAVEYMKSMGKVVWIDVDFEEFLKRCGKDKNRPLLRRGEEELRKLFEERKKIYSLAHLHVKSKNSKEESLRELMQALFKK